MPYCLVGLGLGLGLVLGCGAESTTNPAAPPAEVEPSTEGCDALAASCKADMLGCVGQTVDKDAHCKLCGMGEYPAGDLAQCAVIPGDVVQHEFDPVELAVGEELNGVCQTWTLGNVEELYVNGVWFDNDGGYHHSNWFFVPEGSDYPEGLWKDCYDNGFSEVQAALEGGVIFAQSTQVRAELQKFSNGVAIRIPPYSRIIGATHLQNTQPTAFTTTSRMALHTLEKSEVTTLLTPFRLTYGALDIPAQSTAAFTGTCDIDERFQALAQKPLDLKLYYALPHFHNLGSGFRLEVAGGARDGELIFEHSGFSSDPFGRVFDPPIDLMGSTGLRFTCEYVNHADVAVGWGIGDQEMCVMLGFAASALAFDASVNANTPEAPIDGAGIVDGTPRVNNQGPCNVTAFPFDTLKDGGTPE